MKLGIRVISNIAYGIHAFRRLIWVYIILAVVKLIQGDLRKYISSLPLRIS